MKHRKRKNPGISTMLLLGAAGAGAAYYFLVYRKKAKTKAPPPNLIDLLSEGARAAAEPFAPAPASANLAGLGSLGGHSLSHNGNGSL